MPREKIKFALRIKPETQQLVMDMYPRDNCQSQSEFIEKAIHFYAGYLSAQDASDFLPPILIEALRGVVRSSENHICRMLFKLAVETSMMMNILAAGLDISDEGAVRPGGQADQWKHLLQGRGGLSARI